MASSLSSRFSEPDFPFTSENLCTTTLQNDNAEEGSQACDDTREVIAERKETPDALKELSINARLSQKAEDARKVQGVDHARQCAKWYEASERIEQRTMPIEACQKRYRCQDCEGNVQFSSLYGLYLHLKDHYPPMYCERCYHPSATVEELKTHIKTSPRHFCCQICDDAVEFDDTQSLGSHYETCHSLLYCDLCGHYSKSADESKTHIKISPVHFDCQNCESIVEFENLPALRLHYRHNHPHLYCYSCDQHFVTVEERKIHIKTSPRHPHAETLRNHYAILGISLFSSADQVAKAMREMRSKVHSDGLKR